MRRLFKILLPFALLLLPLAAAHAQGLIPPAIGQADLNKIDYLGWITEAIDQLIATSAGLFVADGFALTRIIAVFMLVLYAIRWMWSDALPLPMLVEFLAKLTIALVLLYYYTNPFPFSGLTVRTIFTDTAHTLSSTIKLDLVNQFLAKASAVTNGLQKPSMFDMMGTLVFESVLFLMCLADAAMFAVTSIGFVATGIGGLLGPLFIPLILIPSWERRFWSWVDFMIVYSFYRVVATAVIFIWATMLNRFFDQVVGLDYSIGHMLAIIPAMAMVMLAFAWSIFKVHTFTVELVGSGGGLGSQFSNSLTRGVAAIFL